MLEFFIHPMKVYIKTYGCQMNERDSENLAAQLVERGHIVVENEGEAEAFVANTCSVREQAELKAIGKLQRVCHSKKQGFPVVGAMGCMAQNLGADLIKKLPKLDIIAGSRKTPYMADYLEDVFKKRKAGIIPRDPPKGVINKLKYADTFVDISDDPKAHELISRHRPHTVQTCAGISIMQGCGMKCAYCIVPKTRGEERSRTIQSIIEEAKFLAQKGAKEILLLGQVANAFGRKEFESVQGRTPFVQLLEKLQEVDGVERLRFVSPHPAFFKKDLIEAYGRLSKLCEYAHLPLQSGSNKILKEMRRPYTVENFLKIVKALRAQKEIFSLSTDIIVGHPNETREDFEASCEALKAANFDMAYIFKYSPRQGTHSAKLKETVSEEEKEKRNQILLGILKKQSLAFNEKLVGATQEILVENSAKRGDNMLSGRTRTHRKVIFKGRENQIGRLVQVKITGAGVSAMTGEQA